MAQKLFGAEDLQAAVRKLDIEVKSHGLTLIEIAVRWIVHHSALGDGDGIIIRTSKTERVEETASMVKKGPLPKELAEMAEQVWSSVEESTGHHLKDIIIPSP